jgi:type IV pilus assembly protein PilC
MSTENIYLFSYKGRSAGNQSVEGLLRAPNIEWAKHKLRKKGIKIYSVKRHWHFPLSNKHKILTSDITLFTRQFATLLRVGIPIRKSFDILTGSYRKNIMKIMMTEISDDILAGNSLAKSLRKHPKQFDDIFCNMVEVGESSGTLTTILERLAGYQQQTKQTKQRIKKAITYPCIVLITAILVMAIMLTQVIPKFAETYSEFDANLPLFTLGVIKLSQTFQQFWAQMLAGCCLCFAGLVTAKKRSMVITHFIDGLRLKLPIVGKLTMNIILARFTQTLATTLSSGLPILDALKCTASTIDNTLYARAIYAIRQDITHGISLYRAMGNQSVFPIPLQQMVNLGEESGSLSQILSKASDMYDEDVTSSLDTIIPLIEPILIMTIGLLIGGLLIAMYLPIFQLGHIM